MRRLFIEGKLTKEIIISGQDALHLLYAMRVKSGQNIIITDALGQTARTKIKSCTAQVVVLSLLERIKDDQESPIKLTLVQCLPKSDKMDYIIQKAVELGVNEIIPAVSHNCVVRYDVAKRLKKLTKWRKIAAEAAKQCARDFIPKVQPITDFQTAIVLPGATCICYENEDTLSFKEYLKEQSGKEYSIIIGPEGGFTDDEVKVCRSQGIKSISLGKRVLRTETAAVTALSVIQYEKGDLG